MFIQQFTVFQTKQTRDTKLTVPLKFVSLDVTNYSHKQSRLYKERMPQVLVVLHIHLKYCLKCCIKYTMVSTVVEQ